MRKANRILVPNILLIILLAGCHSYRHIGINNGLDIEAENREYHYSPDDTLTLVVEFTNLSDTTMTIPVKYGNFDLFQIIEDSSLGYFTNKVFSNGETFKSQPEDSLVLSPKERKDVQIKLLPVGEFDFDSNFKLNCKLHYSVYKEGFRGGNIFYGIESEKLISIIVKQP